METKIKGLKKSRKVQRTVCTLRNLIGESVLAGLAVAYVAEHINQVPHQAAVAVGVVIVGLVLYFGHANQVK
jgi:hypothetical protein